MAQAPCGNVPLSVYGMRRTRKQAAAFRVLSEEGPSAMKLTATSVATLQLPDGKTDHVEWDDTLPGFGHRLREGGGRVRGTYIVQYRTQGRSRRLLLGSTDVLGAEQARAAAKKILAQVALGGDPQGAKQAQRRADDQSLRATIATYLEAKRSEVRNRTFREIERYLTGPHFRSLHTRPLDQITRRDVAGCLTALPPITAVSPPDGPARRYQPSTCGRWAKGWPNRIRWSARTSRLIRSHGSACSAMRS